MRARSPPGGVDAFEGEDVGVHGFIGEAHEPNLARLRRGVVREIPGQFFRASEGLLVDVGVFEGEHMRVARVNFIEHGLELGIVFDGYVYRGADEVAAQGERASFGI